MANQFIYVASARPDAHVVIHERDAQHPAPEHEIFVANSVIPGSENFQVIPVLAFRTAMVDRLIHENQLRIVPDDEAMDMIAEAQARREGLRDLTLQQRGGGGNIYAQVDPETPLTDSGEVVDPREAAGSDSMPGTIAAPSDVSSWPTGVPGITGEQANALRAAGFDTPEKVANASDAELDAVPGIGQSAIDKLRAADRG